MWGVKARTTRARRREYREVKAKQLCRAHSAAANDLLKHGTARLRDYLITLVGRCRTVISKAGAAVECERRAQPGCNIEKTLINPALLGLSGAFGYGVVEKLLHLVAGLTRGVALLLAQLALLLTQVALLLAEGAHRLGILAHLITDLGLRLSDLALEFADLPL